VEKGKNKFTFRASANLSNETLMKNALFSAAILICLSFLMYGCDDQPKVSIGQQGRLMVEGGTLVAVGVSDAALDEWQKARFAHDDHGQFHLMLSGAIYTVNNGTRVLVIDFGSLGVRKVRILEGEMRGRAGYVSSGFIKIGP
jgi:hypothetical protein